MWPNTEILFLIVLVHFVINCGIRKLLAYLEIYATVNGLFVYLHFTIFYF